MKGGKPVVIDDRMARDMAGKILQQAKKTGANNPGPGVPKAVPVTEQEEQGIPRQMNGPAMSGYARLLAIIKLLLRPLRFWTMSTNYLRKISRRERSVH